MHSSLRAFVVLIALFAVLFTGTASAADAPAGKWRLQFQGRATSDGEMQFRLTPQTGEAILVTIKIHSGRSEMYMAKDVLEALKAQLPRGRFRSEIVHGQEVLVKAGREEPAFAFEFVESTVTGPKVKLEPA